MLLPFNSIGRCYGQWIVADDMPLRLMLLPIVYWFNILADVIAIYCGRYYYHFSSVLFLADVIANVFVADVIATKADVIAYKWYFGWCYCQLVADVITTILNVLADVITTGQML